jgi:meso-butanediol dehydrogenase/(S,S)-butanediol dehydrogenase/diacetyl reductase
VSVALVTGAAGGLGAAIAARLAEEHAVLLTDVAGERIADVAGKLAANGTKVAHTV